MFPLKQKYISGYGFGVKTSYSAHHLGVDYRANYVALYAPFNGRVERHDGTQGGITLWFFPHGGLPVMRFMHLSKVVKTGEVKEGEQIAVTGNTGSLTTSPHLHLDISKTSSGTFWGDFNNFINPETYDWSSMIRREWTQGEMYGLPDGRRFWHVPSPEAFEAEIGSDMWNDNKDLTAEIPPKIVEKPVEKIVYVDKPVEVIKEVIKEVPVEKVVYVDKLVPAVLTDEQIQVLNFWDKLKLLFKRS